MDLTRRQLLIGGALAVIDIAAQPVHSILGYHHINAIQSSSDDELPDGLTAVQYLQSTGTQWAKIGQTIGATSIKAVCAASELPSSGCHKAFGVGWSVNFGDDCGVDSTRWCGSSLAPCTIGQFVEIEYNASNRLVDSKVIGGNGTAFLNGLNNGKNLFLFCGTNGTNPYITGSGNYMAWRGCISRFIAFSDDAVLRDIVAVRSEEDGHGYMYDKVSGEVFGNGGTGEFLIGPDL